MTKQPATRKLFAPLLQRWASMPGDEGVAFRNQLEDAASMVPRECRPRVLGPLGERGATDDQVRAAVGVLLLAKTLSDLGWMVEYEPELEGQTPDLRITRGSKQFIVEVRRILGRFQTPTDIAMRRLRDELSREVTRTPIHVLRVSIDGSSSLQPLVRYIKRVLAGPRPEGVLTFNEGRVFLSFEVAGVPFSRDMPIIFGWSEGFTHGDDRTKVRAAIQEKLGNYKLPLRGTRLL